MYTKDLYDVKYKFLIKKRESIELKHFNDPKAFIWCSRDMQDIYKNIDECNPGKKRKRLINSDDMIADMINNKKLNPIMTELLLEASN